MQDIRILVSIDFGTTYSGFAYVHKGNPENVSVNNSWPGREGVHKTPTALQYDEGYKKVTSWGDLALEEEPDEISDDDDDNDDDDDEQQRPRPVELFKLHLSNLPTREKPWLPPQLTYKKAIVDYLTQMRKLIQDTLEKRWPTIRFPHQVDFVFTIPAEWPPNTTKILRDCAHRAGLLASLNTTQLDFTTEPEAAALHCLSVINEHHLQPSDNFLVADCGGGTIDLTTRRLLPGNRLGEVTERVGDLCGSTFVDKEFLQWLADKIGQRALEEFRSNHYGQMQHLVQRFFCQRVKFKFSGEETEFKTLKLNLQQYCPDLPKYVRGEYKNKMEDVGWMLKIYFHSVIKMFDPVVNRIIRLINDQLNSTDEKCQAIFLVGGFSESPYLHNRIKETFKYQVPIIAVPALPIAAIVRGAITYGLNTDAIHDRVLKWTYGVGVCRAWVEGKDDISRKMSNGNIYYFHKMAVRGRNVTVDQKFWGEFSPTRADQDVISFKVYYTPRYSGKFCNDRGMKLLGNLRIQTNDTRYGLNRPIEFSLTFGNMEIKAIAKNKITGRIYKETTFDLDI